MLRCLSSIICDLTGRHTKQGRSTAKRISEQSARTEGPNSGRSTGAPRRERRLRRRTKATTAPPTEGKAPPADTPDKNASAAHRWLPDKDRLIGGEIRCVRACRRARRARLAGRGPLGAHGTAGLWHTHTHAHSFGAEHIALVLCFVTEKDLRGGELPVAAAYRAAVGLAVRSGRPCPYLGLPGGLAQGNRAAQLDMAKKQGGLGVPLSCCIPARARSPTDRSSRDLQGGAHGRPGSVRACVLPAGGQGRPVGFRRCIPSRTHTHTTTHAQSGPAARPGLKPAGPNVGPRPSSQQGWAKPHSRGCCCTSRARHASS